MKVLEQILDRHICKVAGTCVNQCGYKRGVGGNWCGLCSMQNPREALRKAEAIAYVIPGSCKSFWSCSLSAHLVLTAWPWCHWTTHQLDSDLYINTISYVRCAADDSDSFLMKVDAPRIGTVTNAVHPGDGYHHQGLQQEISWNLLYAGDTMLTANTRGELQEQVEAWQAHLRHFGLHLNVLKTGYVKTCLSLGTVQDRIKQLVKSQSFCYLGLHLQCDSSLDYEVRAHINAAWIRWQDVMVTLCDKQMSTYLKSKIYMIMVCPAALYSAECWALNKSLESCLNIMETSMLRQSSGIYHLEHITNEEVQRCMRWKPSVRNCRSGAYNGMAMWCVLTQILSQMLHIHYK